MQRKPLKIIWMVMKEKMTRSKLKIIHTYGVVECSRKIAEGLKLSEEDCNLAQIIGLLHDIGRFEQLKCYDSFEPETMNHAAYGVKIYLKRE